jgi:ribokinase
MSGRVIVVGSVNVDQVITVDRMPGPGETVSGGRFEQHHGGKGGNQAVAAARLGASVVFVGAVGADANGRAARDVLAAEGIDLSRLIELADEPTGVALILVDRHGENRIAVAGGANQALDSVQVRDALKRLAVTGADVLLVGHEIRTGATHEALRLGRLAGATTILNPAPASGLARATLELADIVTPNRGELSTLAGGAGKPSKLAKGLLGPAAGDRAVVVSLGAEGTLLVRREGTIAIPAPAVDVVDTVGAGDALNGALAAGLAAGLKLDVALHRAVVAAGLAVTKAGAREGMPTTQELKRAVTRARPSA